VKLRELKPITVLLILLVVSSVQVLAQSKNFYGAYQDCPFACETIQINPDFTFVHRLNGDLFNDIRTKGTWQFIGKDKIRAVSVANTEPQVTETETNRTGNFLITFIDSTGAIVPGAKISGVANGVAFERTTNSEGVTEIPKCEQFNLAFGGSRNYRGTYKIKNVRADEFTVKLTNEQTLETRMDEVWQVENGCLYFAKEDGSLNKDYCLKKLSRKKEWKIFGK
jgi:hypothetical protein